MPFAAQDRCERDANLAAAHGARCGLAADASRSTSAIFPGVGHSVAGGVVLVTAGDAAGMRAGAAASGDDRMQPDERVDEILGDGPLRRLEPPEQRARLHRRMGPGGEVHVEIGIETARSLETPEQLRRRTTRLGDGGPAPGRAQTLPAEGDAIGLGMGASEVDGGANGPVDRDHRVGAVAREPRHRLSAGLLERSEGADLELAKERVLVWKMPVEGADA